MQKIEHNSLCETESYKVMTDERIIKCLEYKTKVSCELCDLKPDIYCQTCNIGLLKQSLDLINRQKAEFERLKNAYKQCAWERDTFLEQIKTAKTEAIKEFVERLKKISKEITIPYIADTTIQEMKTGMFWFGIEDFNNLVKEMTEQSTMGQVKLTE